MAHSSNIVAVYLEVGKKRTLAGACDWPGWCRAGRDEGAALRALSEYGPRYERVLRASGLQFDAPTDVDAFTVTERLAGNTTTDFGVPDVAPSGDAEPIDATELRRLQELLKACWAALDVAAQAAYRKELRKGPRGGGRDLAGIAQHVEAAEASYLARLGGKLTSSGDEDDPALTLKRHRQIILDTLDAAARGETPLRGPRGGIRWPSQFFVRRAAWHILDHVWEIEDRVL